VVNADDIRSIFLPFYRVLALRMVKKSGYAVILSTKDGISIRRATPEAGFSGNKIPFFYTLLGLGSYCNCSSLPRATARVLQFHRHSAGDFAKGLKSAVVAAPQ